MSDFFTRLAERTLGLAFIIQPIKPSLFAQQRGSIGEALLGIAEESDATQTLSGIQQGGGMPTYFPDSGRTSAQAHPPEVRPVQLERTQVKQSPPTVTLGQASSTEVHIAQLEHSQVEPTATPVRQLTSYIPTGMLLNSVNDPLSHQSVGHRRAPEREPFSSNITHARRSTPVTQEIEVQAQQSSAPRQPLTPPQTRAGSRHEALPSKPKQHGDVSERSNAVGSANIAGISTGEMKVLETSTVPHVHTISQHNFRRDGAYPRPSHLAPSQAQIEATTSEAAIQVTIGRVEVRVVTAPTTATRSQQQPARPSAMSLDEYLQQQERGGRR